MTRPFCRACDRTRLTADGQIRTCLFSRTETDLRGRAAGEVEAVLQALRAELSHARPGGGEGPDFELRATLLDDRIRLHLSLGMLHVDGPSLQILFKDLAVLYRDPEAQLPALELSFRDYVLAEAALRETDFYRRSLAWWKERVRELPPAPQLPLARSAGALDRPRFVHGHMEIEFTNVRVPKENLVGQPNKGWDMAKALLGFERIFLGSPKQSQYALSRVEEAAAALGLLDDPVFSDRYTQLALDVADLGTLYARFVEQVDPQAAVALYRRLGFVGPLILWLAKKDDDPELDWHGREALNFQITVFIAIVISWILAFVLIGLLSIASAKRPRLHDASDAMARAGIRHLAVVDDGEVAGILSVRDLLRYFKNWGPQ